MHRVGPFKGLNVRISSTRQPSAQVPLPNIGVIVLSAVFFLPSFAIYVAVC